MHPQFIVLQMQRLSAVLDASRYRVEQHELPWRQCVKSRIVPRVHDAIDSFVCHPARLQHVCEKLTSCTRSCSIRFLIVETLTFDDYDLLVGIAMNVLDGKNKQPSSTFYP